MSGISWTPDGEAFLLPDPHRVLSGREREVLAGIAEGRSNVEIGLLLRMSVPTVKTYLRRLYAKLGARDRANAVHLAWRRGWLT